MINGSNQYFLRTRMNIHNSEMNDTLLFSALKLVFMVPTGSSRLICSCGSVDFLPQQILATQPHDYPDGRYH